MSLFGFLKPKPDLLTQEIVGLSQAKKVEDRDAAKEDWGAVDLWRGKYRFHDLWWNKPYLTLAVPEGKEEEMLAALFRPKDQAELYEKGSEGWREKFNEREGGYLKVGAFGIDPDYDPEAAWLVDKLAGLEALAAGLPASVFAVSLFRGDRIRLEFERERKHPPQAAQALQAALELKDWVEKNRPA